MFGNRLECLSDHYYISIRRNCLYSMCFLVYACDTWRNNGVNKPSLRIYQFAFFKRIAFKLISHILI